MSEARVRLDKWLWAARFFKTRGLARAAVEGGKIQLNGSRTKPAHAVKVDDQLAITRGAVRFEVVVVELSDRRGPATAAQQLYRETPASIAAREAAREAARAQVNAPRRPDKRDRRRIRAFKERND